MSIIKKECKKFCKNKFAKWYSAEVQKQVDSRVNFEDVNVERKLSVLKPIHATWLMEMYNFFTSAQGRVHILKGWEEVGIKGIVTWREVLPPVDPYQGIHTDDSWHLYRCF